ncbi:Polycomb complex protein BMI-1-A [Exaiptasia diaphana]|nr:Polycomb complex protein BMI-1-A [Exaiptasia diaphana]
MSCSSSVSLSNICRSCIICWLEKSYRCPVCETEIHKTRPYLNIRPDRVLQDIVYKLVPGLYDNELRRRKEFDTGVEEDTKDDSNVKPNKKDDIEDPVCVTLEYYGRKRFWQEKTVFPTRYLRCSSQLPVNVLKKFVSTKFGIPDTHFVEIIRSDEILSDHLSLRELWRVYGLHNKSFIDLQYIIIDKKLDIVIAHQGLDEPKFKKIVKKRKRKRKSSLVGSTDGSGLTPIKRKRRKRVAMVAKRHTKLATTHEGTVQETANGEKKLPEKVAEQTLDLSVNNDTPSVENNKIDEHLQQNSIPHDKQMENDISVNKYACPATPESDADHNDCVTLTAVHPEPPKQASDVVPPS